MSLRVYRTEGIVLKSVTAREADILVTLLTPSVGKLRAVAKGARKPTSKMVGHLEPLTRVDLALARGRNLDIITQAQEEESFASLKGDLDLLSRGLYLAELVDGFAVEGLPSSHLYALLLDTLRLLPRHPQSELPLRHFELQLLRTSGFMPELHCCVECRRPPQPGKHVFSPRHGGLMCSTCLPSDASAMPLSVTALKVLRFLEGTSLAEVIRLRMSLATSGEIANLLSATLRYWLEREVRSASFMRRLESSVQSPAL